MSKTQVNTKVDPGLEDDIERYREEANLESRADAARSLLRRGLRDYNKPGAPARFLRTTSELTLIASMMSLVIAAAFRFPQRMLWVGATFGLLALFCGCAYGIAIKNIRLSGFLSRRGRVATDGGERE